MENRSFHTKYICNTRKFDHSYKYGKQIVSYEIYMQYKKILTSNDETNMGSSDIHEVPPFFLCPISLEMMKDPVTLSTGVTYDRDSIRQWIFDYGRLTCPVTKQLLAAADVAAGFTPNSTLLRLIHQWHADHPPKTTTTTSSSSNAAIDEATPTFDISILLHLADDMRLDQSHQTRTKAVKGIKQLVQESDHNKQWLRESDLVYALASLIIESEQQELIIASPGSCRSSSTLMEDAMNVLYLLKPPREVMKKLGEDGDGKMIAKLSLVLQRGSYQSRVVSVLLLKHFFKVVSEKYKSKLPPELFHAMAEILKDQNSSRETMAALSILVQLTHYQSNHVKAIEAGLMGVLVELLAESKERRSCELMLGVMEALCSRADGRAAFGAHAAGVAAVVGKVTGVSAAESEAAVKVLVQVCKSERVVEEMVEVGGVGRLCMVVQSDVGRKTKDKAKQLLALNFNVWSKSPCFHSSYFINYY